ncbi:MAG: tetratricopeptide repeat protein [bacterium]|nr:tetratricopeptide repeat protein [bacterium]
MRAVVVLLAVSWIGWWLTPEQQGMRYFRREQFVAAAESFQDPLWIGTAWYRAGEFEKAAQAFSRRDTAEANFNQGNAWVLLGKYQTAIEKYDRALQLRPEWPEALQNREIAEARAKMLDQGGGDMGDQKIGADEVVFDKDKKPGGQETEVAADQAVSDSAIQAMWLRRVQTQPADFLRAKFAYQQANASGDSSQ